MPQYPRKFYNPLVDDPDLIDEVMDEESAAPPEPEPIEPAPGYSAGPAYRKYEELVRQGPTVYAKKDPKLLNKLGAIALSFGQGYSNAMPGGQKVDVSEGIEGILYPGQKRKEAAYEKELQSTGKLAQAESTRELRKGQADKAAAEERAKQRTELNTFFNEGGKILNKGDSIPEGYTVQQSPPSDKPGTIRVFPSAELKARLKSQAEQSSWPIATAEMIADFPKLGLKEGQPMSPELFNKIAGTYTAESGRYPIPQAIRDLYPDLPEKASENFISQLIRDTNNGVKLVIQTLEDEVTGDVTTVGRDPATGKVVMQDTMKGAARKRPLASSSRGGSSGDDDAEQIAQAIVDGNQPPILTGLYGKGAAVRAALAKKGFDLTTAARDYSAVQRHMSTLNGAQQERLRQAITFTSDSLDAIENLYGEWVKEAGSSGFKALNKVSLVASKQLPGNAGAIAANLEAQINDLTSELGTVYKGGNASTDESLRLAAENLKGEWNEATFKKAITQIKNNLRIRRNSIMQSQPVGVSSNSPYSPKLPPPEPAPTPTGVVRVNTREERDALPAGTRYMGSDGKIAVKR